ncbi:MAG: D-alanyl-D-alanine carboxypeptidase/D-alanyl-D-alanine-endopeptidase, partial [Muribaculaceae bacterium]|nr:D-alanyl-D-alanine carboxypeptidase/D-alanyl-D-alanine-endopeptidase [Muribaculaceae bacterium]
DAGPSPLWEIEDVAWSYGAALFGLNWRDNVFRLWPATGRTKPHVPGLKIDLRASSEGNDLLRGVGSNTLVVSGRDVRNQKWTVVSTMPNPEAVFVYELKERLRSAGISLGERKTSVAGDDGTVVYVHRSPRAAQILRSLMVRSDNMMADGMLRAIDPTGSRPDAIKKEKALWDSLGVSMRYMALCDGSGLSPVNRISPATMGAILENMARSEYADDYIALFPRAGRDGTLRNFMAKTELNGKLALKTGSVSAVQCYAGYLLDSDDCPTHVVVVMVNAFYCPRSKLREAISNFLIQTLISNQANNG